MSESAFAPIFPGWNVWRVYQVKDLPFSLMMVGVSPERQLKIWVEDEVRLHSAADVADPLDLKGSQVEIIQGAPGLSVAMGREQVPSMRDVLLSGPAELYTVRFFNKGGNTQLAWPHDDSYLLDQVLEPKADNPATSGPSHTTIGETVGTGITKPLGDVLGSVPWYVWAGLTVVGVGLVVNSIPAGTVRKVHKSVRRIRNA